MILAEVRKARSGDGLPALGSIGREERADAGGILTIRSALGTSRGNSVGSFCQSKKMLRSIGHSLLS